MANSTCSSCVGLGSVSSTHVIAHNCHNLVPGAANDSLAHMHIHTHIHVTHKDIHITQTEKQAHTHIQKYFLKITSFLKSESLFT